jgi:hypothetical protein
MPRLYGVADAGEHIGYWVGYGHLLLVFKSSG